MLFVCVSVRVRVCVRESIVAGADIDQLDWRPTHVRLPESRARIMLANLVETDLTNIVIIIAGKTGVAPLPQCCFSRRSGGTQPQYIE